MIAVVYTRCQLCFAAHRVHFISNNNDAAMMLMIAFDSSQKLCMEARHAESLIAFSSRDSLAPSLF